MKPENSIKVYYFLGGSPVSREQADLLFEAIAKMPGVSVDFAGVDFISRSFADQFHKGLTTLLPRMAVSVINASLEVRQMLEAVSRTQSARQYSGVASVVRKFSSKEELREFLRSVG
jgi:hypothetical protein